MLNMDFLRIIKLEVIYIIFLVFLFYLYVYNIYEEKIVFILILRLLLDELVSNECGLDYFISCFSSLNNQDD